MGIQYPVGYALLSLLLIVTLLSIPSSPCHSKAAKKEIGKSIANVQTTFFLFNLSEDGIQQSYQLYKGSDELPILTTSYYGVAIFEDLVAPGDSYNLIPSGANPQAPSKPTGFAAAGGSDGCVSLNWNENPEPNIVDYTLYWATASVEQGQLPAYTDSVSGLVNTERTQCNFAEGTYYLSLRARNSFGMLSPPADEAQATVTVSSQAPPPPQEVAVNETVSGCATVSWQAGSEPDIAGYYVYYGTQSVEGGAAAYTDSVDAGNTTQVEICEFAQGGTFYFAVRTYTTGDLFSAYSEEVPLVVDVTPPSFANLYPAYGSDGVYVNTSISLLVLDAQSGVDSLSISVRINGSPPASIAFGSKAESLQVSCSLSEDLPPLADITVKVIARDRAAFANTDSISWQFTTGDTAAIDDVPPVICCENPPSGSIDVNTDEAVRVRVSDDGSGIDFTQTYLIINDEPVEYTFDGDHQSAVLSYSDHDGFSPGDTVRVAVIASDRSSPPNVELKNDYWFVVVEEDIAIGTPESPAEIVPDGYWAHDPDKPLEIRNLPPNWTIRIFNTAGIQVRSYKNQSGIGMNWVWENFTNDRGRRVARALYLIRITDSSGEVKKSGRFLVQRDP
jgi:hypothetical protein